MEILCAKEDYRINRSYITPTGILCLDIPKETLQSNSNKRNLFVDPLQDIPEEESPPPPIDSEPAVENRELNDLGNDGTESDRDAPNSDDVPDIPELPELGDIPEPDPEPEPEDEPPPLPPLEPMEVEETSEKNNVNGSDIVEFPAYGLRKRGEKEKTVVIKLKEPWKPLDPHAETPAKRPIRAGRIRRPLPCSCHTPSTVSYSFKSLII